MNINILKTPIETGQTAAVKTATLIADTIARQGYARMVVSTGQSQFEFFEALTAMDIPWPQVELFHLDEYIGLPITHKASFRKYLKERFICKAPGASMHYVSGEGDIVPVIANLNAMLREKPVDIGVIGIGENAHIAFNDPPADFDTEEPYIVVTLDEACRRQQVREGWFPMIDDVPKQAISMSVRQILSCKTIVSVVPHSVKAIAVRDTLSAVKPVSAIPASALTAHSDWHLYLDEASASLLESRPL